jgi:D-alanyl-D-alanine carboxypeptidase/D-alanyl-D-alanine-endopeptidase (penicillin-binding protein 4)
VADALTRAKVPPEAISVLVVNADGQSAPRLNHRADVPMNPASVMKLLTTIAALDLLGPAFVWRTPVWLDGPVKGGVLKGNLLIQGQGDPKLVLEKLWLLLRRVQGLGVLTIDGNIVLDRNAFATVPVNPAEFDGEPLRPYNVSPDALLINYKSVLITLTPDLTNAVARVQIDPPLSGVQVPATVPLQKTAAADCGDYRKTLKANFSDPTHIRLAGSYPLSCGEKIWPVAYSDPASYNARTIAGLWRSMGGKLTGSVLDGIAPTTPATFEVVSPPLADVIRDINKFSNNVMAEQLFLTLGRTNGREVQTTQATPEAARETLRQWWLQRINTLASTAVQALPAPVLDNGSGLSRQTRMSAQQLARLMQVAYASPYMPELMSSLPIVGIDGTLKRSQAALASAHLKTGSLQGVLALAGFVHAAGGQQVCLVALINHPNASAARPALDALIYWTLADSAK